VSASAALIRIGRPLALPAGVRPFPSRQGPRIHLSEGRQALNAPVSGILGSGCDGTALPIPANDGKDRTRT
jgi:hypothetical protein